MTTNRLLLLDVDGTVREPASGGQFIQHPLDQKIMHGVDIAIAAAVTCGWFIIGITNQADYTVYSHPGYSSFRKPAPGMIEYAIATHSVDECPFVGDRPEDEQAVAAPG